MNTLGFEKTIKATMSVAEEKVTEALKQKGFGILTKIDFALQNERETESRGAPYPHSRRL
jgi:uncharacterized protein (DUF302 family)